VKFKWIFAVIVFAGLFLPGCHKQAKESWPRAGEDMAKKTGDSHNPVRYGDCSMPVERNIPVMTCIL
jgi:hypothetical protein